MIGKILVGSGCFSYEELIEFNPAAHPVIDCLLENNMKILILPPRETSLQIINFWPMSDEYIPDNEASNYYVYLFKDKGVFAIYSNNTRDYDPNIMWGKSKNCSIETLNKWLKEINMFSVLSR